MKTTKCLKIIFYVTTISLSSLNGAFADTCPPISSVTWDASSPESNVWTGANGWSGTAQSSGNSDEVEFYSVLFKEDTASSNQTGWLKCDYVGVTGSIGNNITLYPPDSCASWNSKTNPSCAAITSGSWEAISEPDTKECEAINSCQFVINSN